MIILSVAKPAARNNSPAVKVSKKCREDISQRDFARKRLRNLRFQAKSPLTNRDELETLPAPLRRTVEKFRGARNVVQGQFHSMDSGRDIVVRTAIEFCQCGLFADRIRRHLEIGRASCRERV